LGDVPVEEVTDRAPASVEKYRVQFNKWHTTIDTAEILP
jgi:hypothetical protein